MEKSLYIHIPFCRRKCLYCDFYSVAYENGLAAPYACVMADQISSLKGMFSTIYIGGGTPSVLDSELLKKIFNAIQKGQGSGVKGQGVEFTVEANPESLTADKIKLFLDSGVNRLSIGIQSLDDRILKRLGRLHDADQATSVVSNAAKSGFKNIGVDLIFGVWGESLAGWEKGLKMAARLPVTHISAYSLTYEKSTPLFSAVKNGSVKPLEDDTAAAMYERAIDLLAQGGFKQYEVSNFAKAGFECRHNLNYWDNGGYIGIGASAVSYTGGVRAKNIADIKEYIRRFRNGNPLVESSEKLSPVRRAKETAAVKIRTRAGIDFGWFRAKTGFDFLKLEGKAVEKLLSDDLIKYTKSNNQPSGIALKRNGFLHCDTVSSALL